MVVEPAAARRMVVGAGDKERAAVVLAPLLSTEMSGGRERLWETLVWPVGEVDLWAPSLLFVHDAGVLELLDEGFFPSVT